MWQACPKKESALFVNAVEAATENAQNLTEIHKNRPVRRAGLHNNNMLATKAHQGRSQSRTVATIVRASRSATAHGSCALEPATVCRKKAATVFAACGHIYAWRRGTRILLLRHGLEPSEVALSRLYPMQSGEEADNQPHGGQELFADDQGGKDHGVGDVYKMIENLRSFFNNADAKALLSMGDVCQRAFNDRVARVDPQWTTASSTLEVFDISARTLKTHGAGSVRNLGTSPAIPPALARHLHRKCKVDGADGSHQKPPQRNGLFDDSTNGTGKNNQEQSGDGEVRREAGGKRMKALQARSEEERTQHMDIESWQELVRAASI